MTDELLQVRRLKYKCLANLRLVINCLFICRINVIQVMLTLQSITEMMLVILITKTRVMEDIKAF